MPAQYPIKDGAKRSEKFIDIGTHQLWVVLSHLPSEHTVVLEAGSGKDSDSYQVIQDQLASFILGLLIIA